MAGYLQSTLYYRYLGRFIVQEKTSALFLFWEFKVSALGQEPKSLPNCGRYSQARLCHTEGSIVAWFIAEVSPQHWKPIQCGDLLNTGKMHTILDKMNSYAPGICEFQVSTPLPVFTRALQFRFYRRHMHSKPVSCFTLK